MPHETMRYPITDCLNLVLMVTILLCYQIYCYLTTVLQSVLWHNYYVSDTPSIPNGHCFMLSEAENLTHHITHSDYDGLSMILYEHHRVMMIGSTKTCAYPCPHPLLDRTNLYSDALFWIIASVSTFFDYKKVGDDPSYNTRHFVNNVLPLPQIPNH